VGTPTRSETDALVRAHYARLLGLAENLLGDRARAEDAVLRALEACLLGPVVGDLRLEVIRRCRPSPVDRLREIASGQFVSVGLDQPPSAYLAALVSEADLDQAGVRLLERIDRSPRTTRRLAVAAVLAAGVMVVAALAALVAGTAGSAHGVAPPHQRNPAWTAAGPAVPGSYPSPLPTVGLVGFPALDASPSSPEHGVLLGSYFLVGPDRPYEGDAWLFRDGRLVWRLLGPALAAPIGYVEQRLTPSGVDVVLNEPDGLARNPWNLATWLPATAWADRTLRPYVPAHFAACLEPDPGVDDVNRCTSLTTAEARRLAGTLVRAGFTPVPEATNTFAMQLPPPIGELRVSFDPVLPDSTVVCANCR
jgi:hypothetical protein